MLRNSILVFALFSTTCVISAFGQSQRVSFVHGLGDDTSVWNDMANELLTEFEFSRYDVGYNTFSDVSSTASGAYIPYQSIGVAHSLGGLVSREYLRQNGASRLKALVTVGTPHTGAKAAQAVQNGLVESLTNNWLDDLYAGPYATLGQTEGGRFARFALSKLGLNPEDSGKNLAYHLDGLYGEIPSVDDMKPESPFLNTLNASPNATLPSSRYAIYGSEHFYDYARLFDSFRRKNSTGNPMESGTVMVWHNHLTTFYFWVGSYYTYIASKWLSKYQQSDYSDPLYSYYYNRFAAAEYAARQWYRGFLSLLYYQQRDWDYYITGARYYTCLTFEVCKDPSDGLLTYLTQAPSFIGPYNDRNLHADGANHLEETVHPNVKQRLAEIFNRENIPPLNDGGGGDDGGDDPPPPPDGDCTDPTRPCKSTDVQ